MNSKYSLGKISPLVLLFVLLGIVALIVVVKQEFSPEEQQVDQNHSEKEISAQEISEQAIQEQAIQEQVIPEQVIPEQAPLEESTNLTKQSTAPLPDPQETINTSKDTINNEEHIAAQSVVEVKAEQPKKTITASEKPVQPKPRFIEPEMEVLPAGTFTKGSLLGSHDERPVHTVNIKSFAVAKYEVTFAEYDLFASATKRDLPEDISWGRGNLPVMNVSWDDAKAYVKWLSAETGRSYRLLTESEWEYAARAGSSTKYYWGDQAEANYANGSNKHGWPSDGYIEQSAPVGQYLANKFNLFDMSGNLWEWVEDCYSRNYHENLTQGEAWDTDDCKERVHRGGSWVSKPANMGSANRSRLAPDLSVIFVGFRIARDL